MSISVTTNTWQNLESWWGVYQGSPTIWILDDIDYPLADPGDSEMWYTVDKWWDRGTDTYDVVSDRADAVELAERNLESEWSALEPWWDTHVRDQHEALRRLETVFQDVEQAWVNADSPFHVDPLSTDWRSGAPHTGPMWIRQEENWSHWLAHLIRTGPDGVLGAITDREFGSQPTAVDREVYLDSPDPAEDARRADILVFTADGGLSIEVKKGDEAYEKTTDTAALVDRQYGGEWEHHLLLPAHKLDSLQETFPGADKLDNADDPQLDLDNEPTITITYWREVSAWLRRALLTRDDIEDHWAASAYLFCTLIEEQILGFTPQPTVDRLAGSRDVVAVANSLIHSRTTLREQIDYLTEATPSMDDERGLRDGGDS